MNPEITEELIQVQIQLLLYDLGIIIDTKSQLNELYNEINGILPVPMGDKLLSIIESLEMEEALMMNCIDKLN